MKTSFQVIHNFKDEPLKVISKALLITFREDLYVEINLGDAIDLIKVNLSKTLNPNENICCFELDIDIATYEISRHDEFIEGFISRIKGEKGYIRIVKYVDEIRTENYLKYYREISEIEMKIREIFSFIFYYKYESNDVDNLEEYDIKYPAEKPTKQEFEARNENPFFYFTFNGYYQFDKPKEIPVKEIIPLIQSNELYDNLRNFLNLRGILEERHIDFLKKIKEKLSSIESVRNCIAHNRTIPNRAILNYEKTKPEVLKYIEEFWEEEIRIEKEKIEVSFAEQYSYDRIINLLHTSDWNEENFTVTLNDVVYGQITGTYNDLDSLKQKLVEVSNYYADESFPADLDEKSTYVAFYDENRVVNNVLLEFKRELITLDWI